MREQHNDEIYLFRDRCHPFDNCDDEQAHDKFTAHQQDILRATVVNSNDIKLLNRQTARTDTMSTRALLTSVGCSLACHVSRVTL